MPADLAEYAYRFRDAKGMTARMLVVIGDASAAALDVDAGTLKTSLAAVSNANVAIVSRDYDLFAYGTAADYRDVEDKAVLTFVAADASLHRFQLPAPKTAIFLADGETVDAANAAIVTLVGNFTSFVYSKPGSLMGTFLGGIRIRRKLHRRFNIYTKNPALTGPGE